MMRFAGKVVLITGAAQGIGAEIATRFAAEGAITYICDVKEPEGPTLAKKLTEAGGKAFSYHLDVTDEKNWEKVMAHIQEKHGKLDVLVNNAGLSIIKPFEEYPVEALDRILAVNVKGVFLGMKQAVRIMKEQKSGCIVNISSIAGLIGHKYSTIAYIASKGAVTMMTKGVAAQYAPYKIRVNSIHPSTVATPMVAKLLEDPEKRKEREGEIPLGRLATTDDVASAVLFLASDAASFITGVSLPVDGGLTAC
jgi:cyclopentanol dehydrogenase